MKRRLAALLLVVGVAGALPCHTAGADDTTSTTAPPVTLLPADDPSAPSSTVAAVDTPGQPTVTGPKVTIEPSVVSPGERALITVSGFKATVVTITVCGNEARRGSADCNMQQSQGIQVPAGEWRGVRMIISEPVPTCPCIIRVTSDGMNEIAVAPVTITGHPVGPLVDPPSFGDLIHVEISTNEVSDGFWSFFKAGLGGATPIDVTVAVKNLTTTTMHNLNVNAVVGRNDSDFLADAAFDSPGALPPGQTWRQTVRAVVKAPAFGKLTWRATVSGAGQTVTAYDTVEHKPVLLMIGSLAAIAGLFIVVIRFLVRRHIRDELRQAAAPGPVPAIAG